MANCSITVKEELTKFFFKNIYFWSNAGPSKICDWLPLLGCQTKFLKNSKNQKFKFFECSTDVQEHIFKEKNLKIFFSWSVEILKVGELQRASVYQGVVQKK